MEPEARATTATPARPALGLVHGIATVLQLVGIALALFGDIGFDHPGRYGLAFGHLLLIAAVVPLAWVTAIICVAIARRRSWLTIQLALLVADLTAAGVVLFLDR